MAGEKHRLVEDVHFIFSECERFDVKVRSGQKVEPNSPEAMEHFCTIPHPEVSWSFQVCGRMAYDRLETLAHQSAKNAAIDGTVAIASLRKELATVLVRKFQTQKMLIDIRNVERAMSEAAKRCASRRKDIDHYFPCHLMLAKEPDFFQIGPVSFYSQQKFRSEYAKILFRERSGLRKSLLTLRHAFDYYSTFGWVAKVRICKCDSDISKDIAEESVAAALDCIHLLLGYQYTQRMVIGGPAIRVDRRAHLSVSEESPAYSVSYGGPGQVGFPDDWGNMLNDPGWQSAFNHCGIALEVAINPRLNRPLSRRFLDATKWYGEAVREKSGAAKLVKYITSLERMLMTDEKDDIAETVSRRAATMCFDFSIPTSFAEWKSETKATYSLRSKLVHGSISPGSAHIMKEVGLSAKIAEAAIHSALAGFGPEGLRAENVPTKRLAEWFDKRVAAAEMHVSVYNQTSSTEARPLP